jgi:hypothetical protein
VLLFDPFSTVTHTGSHQLKVKKFLKGMCAVCSKAISGILKQVCPLYCAHA